MTDPKITLSDLAQAAARFEGRHAVGVPHVCGSCKHFGEPYEHSDWDDNNAEYVTKYHVCDLIKQINGYNETPLPQMPAGVIDASGYSATFCVTDDFGCVHWEGK